MKYIISLIATLLSCTLQSSPIVVEVPSSGGTVTLKIVVVDKPQPKPEPKPQPKPQPKPKPAPENIKIVRTSVQGTAYRQKKFQLVNAKTVYAFKFKTVPRGKRSWGNGSFANTTLGEGAKTLRIVRNPGDTTPVSRSCSRTGTGAQSLGYYVNVSPVGNYCVLEPNTTYYMQVVNEGCSGGASCGFMFDLN